MTYNSDFTVFISFKKGDDLSFEQILKKVFASGKATWKDNTKDIIKLPKSAIALELTQIDNQIMVSYRDASQVHDFYGDTHNGDIILSPKEFVSFWQDPISFFPPLDDEEKEFFKNLTWGNGLGERILTLYTIRNRCSMKRAKQARVFNGMATRRQSDKESCEKQKKYSDLLDEKIKQRKGLYR